MVDTCTNLSNTERNDAAQQTMCQMEQIERQGQEDTRYDAAYKEAFNNESNDTTPMDKLQTFIIAFCLTYLVLS